MPLATVTPASAVSKSDGTESESAARRARGSVQDGPRVGGHMSPGRPTPQEQLENMTVTLHLLLSL